MTPVKFNKPNNGTQEIYRFPNGYGASVVRHDHSYGGKVGQFEVAVITFTGSDPDKYSLCYDTSVTNDVMVYLDHREVADALDAIQALPAVKCCPTCGK